MNLNHLYEKHLLTQNNYCALQTSPECRQRQGELPERYLCQVDHFPIKRKDNGPTTQENTRVICLECDWDQEGNRPQSKYPELRTLYKAFKLYQDKEGSAYRQRKAMLGDLQNTSRSPYFNVEILNDLEEEEERAMLKRKEYEKRIKAMLKPIPEYKWMMQQPGLGAPTIAFLLSTVDITKADHASSLWGFFGYMPNSKGKAIRNDGRGKRFKSVLYAALLMSTILKKTSPYRQDYDLFRTKGFKHQQAVMRVTKLWLAHLWETWRAREGLPITTSYAQGQMGHETIITAKQRGWTY